MQKTEKEEENAMPVYRVIIAGCRDFQDYALLKEKCEYYLQNKLQSIFFSSFILNSVIIRMIYISFEIICSSWVFIEQKSWLRSNDLT